MIYRAALATIFVFLLSCSKSPFPDPAFEHCVEVNKYDKNTDYHGFTLLVCDGMEIADLEGIQEMKLLETVKLRENFIRNIGPLADLKKLKHLELQDNYLTIEDLDVLSQLTALEYLNIDDNCLNGPVDKEQEIFDKIHASNPSIEIDGNALSMKTSEECK